jgi:hypothetical protein
MSKHPVPLFCHSGSRQFPRLIIHDGQRYWTGVTWSDDPNDAQLFFDTNVATDVVDEIYQAMAKDKAVEQVVRVPMEMMVYSDQGVDLKTLQDWLMNSVKISMNRHECGNGPNDSIVLITFRIGEIAELPC